MVNQFWKVKLQLLLKRKNDGRNDRERPLRIEHHWQALYRGSFYRGGPILTSALSGIEQAMWDILGKSLNTPVHQLLVEQSG